MILEPKHKNFEGPFQIKKLISGAIYPYRGFLNYITLRQFLTGVPVPLNERDKIII
jgi:hypothetical protein